MAQTGLEYGMLQVYDVGFKFLKAGPSLRKFVDMSMTLVRTIRPFSRPSIPMYPAPISIFHGQGHCHSTYRVWWTRR
jgi:hypothetical protein